MDDAAGAGSSSGAACGIAPDANDKLDGIIDKLDKFLDRLNQIEHRIEIVEHKCEDIDNSMVEGEQSPLKRRCQKSTSVYTQVKCN